MRVPDSDTIPRSESRSPQPGGAETAEDALKTAEYFRLAAEVTRVGIFDFNPTTGVLYWDARCKALFGLPPDAHVDYDVFLAGVHPEDRERTDAVVRRAIDPSSDAGGEYEVEFRTIGLADGVERYVLAKGRAFFNAERTHAERFVGTVLDRTELRRAEERERARLTEVFMRTPAFMAVLHGPDHVFAMANPPYYQLAGHRDIIGKSVREALPEVVEQGFIDLLDRVYRTGEPFVGTGVSVALQMTPSAPLETRILDFTYQQLLDADGSTLGVLVHGIDLTEQRRLEREREQLLAQEHARAEREALLNQIGQAVRATNDPDEVQAQAVALLGKALKLDRCYFAVYDPVRPIVHVGRDWHRDDIPSMEGEYTLASLAKTYEELYREGCDTTVFDDVIATARTEETRATMKRLRMRAFLGVALRNSDGALVASLRAAMADEPRAWTVDEISLLEQAATLVRTAVEAARVQRRQRTIAEQLQDALMPVVPPSPPGLALASYYRPALEEAGVGGDFFDVFAVEKGCTALVVADLSGKGLAAAQQIATVRNMLRFALYTSQTVAEAVTTLHYALAEHDLLTGFATLFVGVYNHAERTLTYVNCGQEPGLVRRATTGAVEALVPTGPVLGGFATGSFTQETLTLTSGDTLALFTDGLTEVGPTRKELLEIHGVTHLLRNGCAEVCNTCDPAAVMRGLIAGVDGFARGGLWDDIALLVGVVE